MTKTELIEEISETMNQTKKEAKEMVDTLIAVLSKELADGKEVSIAGLGTFKVVHRKARIGRNPSTGEKMDIKASKAVSFKAAKALKENVNH